MKVRIHLSPSGAEYAALGKPLYSWHLQATVDDQTAGKDHIFLEEVEVKLPGQVALTEVAVKDLGRQLQESMAEAEVQQSEIRKRRENLLSLSYSPVTKQMQDEADDDIPF